MRLSDFDFRLPPELVAQQPADRRDGSRLLVLPPSGPPEHRAFADLPEFLREGDVLVLNNTRVMPARLILRRATGGRVDALLVRERGERTWEALLDTSRRLAEGERLDVEPGVRATIAGRGADRWVLEFDAPVAPLMARLGRAPLPPYVRRDADAADLARYQTVYAERDGAIAAPTAGLHFTPEMLDALARRVEVVKVTLHVGTGTFKPVKVENVDEHVMDPEWYEIAPDAAAALTRAIAARRRIVAVGTTACRTLESWARTGSASGWTDLFIRPPFEFRVVGALLTNFHVPKSTLVMLVAAFSGRERIFAAYAEGIERRYRFFSYGDATLLLR
jgi:S-adenosylmethionine:tRNA ribosyltransferase-isomerase